jgi:hypothetical protein
VTQGRVSFSAASGKPVDPMNVVISGGICNPAKAVCGYTCETCDGCTTFQLVPNPGSGTVGVLMQFYAQCPWTTGVLQDYTGTSVWATDPVIISFEGPGLGDPTDPGSTTVSAQMGTITVYKPASLSASGTPTQSGTQPCTGPCLANPNTGSCSTVTNGKQCSYTESLFTRSYNVVSQFPGVTFPSAGIPLANIA